ncbi:serpentine receptor, putative [Plasmodium gallinaceum]|uniref:Serpentine receptor, putative n=1 Tax=Plasmodium gallinaceum TaxID=5849 RepID=A0A1J1GQJ1_PLAGA|nr:serpentine receptor, putative [Plasmodium gallinaceum]CRG94532.1 serpentine receptor, putative [Plasmodium gallinaceum]
MIRRILKKKRLITFLFLFLYFTNLEEKFIKKEVEKIPFVSIFPYTKKYKNNFFLSVLLYVKKMRVEFHNSLLKRINLNNFFVSSKVIYGLYDDENISKFSNFCYSKSSKKGILILSNLFIPNSKLLILDKTDDEIYNYAKNKKGKKCEDLEKEALFTHSFKDIPSEFLNSSYFIYETNIDQELTEKYLNFILINCGNKIKNAFKIEFRNNINFLKNHFSCEEQGLIEIHMLLTVILIVLSLVYFRKREKLTQINSTLGESINCAFLFFFFSNLFYSIHLISYASNGSGFSILKVLSQIYESIFDCFIITIIFYMYNKNNNKKFEETFKLSFTYSILKFIYILFEIQNHQDLNLYSTLHSAIGFPFIVNRIIVAILIYINGNKLLKEKKDLNEKFFILFDTLLYNIWILSIPVHYFFMKNSSLHFTHLFIHFVNLFILIYLVYNLSQKKYEILDSKHPYLDL